MKLVLFDLDGTLTRRDTLWSFLRFYAGNLRFFSLTALASPWLILRVLRLVSAETAKRKLLALFLKGKRKEEIESVGEAFCAKRLPWILNEDQMMKLQVHQSAGDKICIVTASCAVWVEPFCKAQKADIIATELDFTNGIFNGNFKTPNCKGMEKVRRIKQRYKLEDFEQIIAFGNAGPDDDMLNLAHIKHVV